MMKFLIEVEIDETIFPTDSEARIVEALEIAVAAPWGNRFCDADKVKVRRVITCDHFAASGPGHQSISRCEETIPGHTYHHVDDFVWTDDDERPVQNSKHHRLAFAPYYG